MGVKDLENSIFFVYLEKDKRKTELFKGTIWECETWVRENGMSEATYVITRKGK